MRRDPQPWTGGWRSAGRARLAGVLGLPAMTVALLCAASLASAATGPALSVDVAAERHTIAPEIYGMSFADPQLAQEIGLPLSRWGGNTSDRYNWRIDTWNTGRDWFFENTSGCWNEADDWCANPPADPSQGYRRILDGDRAVGARTLLTLPMVGDVAGSQGTGQPLPCSFPTAAIPGQDQVDPYAPCGRGLVGGRPVAPGANVGTPSDARLSADWIADIRARYGAGAVSFYGLGNEPMLWPETHRDVHPARTSYDELRDKSVALAAAAKRADPSGATLGPSEWGWPNYFCSALDGAPELACDETTGATLPDRAAHGGEPLVAWYLDRMRAEGERQSCRLLDYFDLHYYAQGGSDTGVTRSLWDPSYTDPSWIARRIALLPRMHDWVDAHYPGTRLALSEYDLSLGGDEVTDTLIQADALGIFGRERLDLAARWDPPAAEEAGANAFRLFRDYDGAGGRFGDTSVRALSGDQGRLAVYAATRGADGALTVVLVNKTSQSLTSAVALSGSGAESGNRVGQAWQWAGAAPTTPPQRVADVGISGGAASVTVPARSLTLVVVPAVVAVTGTPQPTSPAPAGCREPGGGDPDPGPGPGGGPDPNPGGAPNPNPRGNPGPRPTPSGAGTPAPLPRPPPRVRTLPVADRVGLPSAARCIPSAAKQLSFRLRSPTGRRVAAATVTLLGGRASTQRTLRGTALKRAVAVTRLPRRGGFTVTVRLRLAGDRRPTVAQRRYQRCR